MATWLKNTPFDEPYRHYYIALDSSGNILAGLALTESHRAREYRVSHMPIVLRWLTTLFKLILADGIMKQLEISRMWFAPGQEEAARLLWAWVRWVWRERGTSLLLYHDSRGPLTDILNIPFWKPQGKLTLANIEPSPPMSLERLIYPPLVY